MYLNHEMPEPHTGFLPSGSTGDPAMLASEHRQMTIQDTHVKAGGSAASHSLKKLGLDTVLTASDMQRLLRILTAQS
jgi:hypothetical protein